MGNQLEALEWSNLYLRFIGDIRTRTKCSVHSVSCDDKEEDEEEVEPLQQISSLPFESLLQ